MTTINDLNNWLRKPENITLEFKEAQRTFSQNRDLPDYCAALANEGGGKLYLELTIRPTRLSVLRRFTALIKNYHRTTTKA